MTSHYRRGEPEGCFITFGWLVAAGIILWLFILGALVPWFVNLIRGLS